MTVNEIFNKLAVVDSTDKFDSGFEESEGDLYPVNGDLFGFELSKEYSNFVLPGDGTKQGGSEGLPVVFQVQSHNILQWIPAYCRRHFLTVK